MRKSYKLKQKLLLAKQKNIGLYVILTSEEIIFLYKTTAKHLIIYSDLTLVGDFNIDTLGLIPGQSFVIDLQLKLSAWSEVLP